MAATVMFDTMEYLLFNNSAVVSVPWSKVEEGVGDISKCITQHFILFHMVASIYINLYFYVFCLSI